MKQNLPFFLKSILDVDYLEMKLLAPTKALRKLFHEDTENNWTKYENGYIELLDERNIKLHITPEML